MEFPFFKSRQETPSSVREKAESLLARSLDESRETKGSFQSGENRLKRAGLEGDFRQFRNYREGDRPQDIDWKRSARSDETLIREREKNQKRIVDLYIQNDKGMHFASSGLPTKYENAAILATALGIWASRHHDPLRLHGHKTNIDDLPAIILTQKNAPPPQWQKNAITVLMGDYTDPMEILEPVFSPIQSVNVLLLQTFDPAELELPYRGRHVFEDGKQKITINNTESIRSDYQSALYEHINALKNYCLKRDWHYDLIRTDQDMVPHLNRALAAIGDRP